MRINVGAACRCNHGEALAETSHPVGGRFGALGQCRDLLLVDRPQAAKADVVQFMGDGVLEFFAADLGIEVEEDGGIGGKFPDKAVCSRLDDGIDLGVDDSLRWKVGEDMLGGAAKVRLLPALERLAKPRRTLEEIVGKDKLLEVLVGKSHGRVIKPLTDSLLALLQALVRGGS